MPVYEYQCPTCGEIQEKYRSVKSRNRKPKCETCKVPMARCILPPRVAKWDPDWEFPNLDNGPDKDHMCFESEAEYQAFLKKHDIREIGGPRCTKNHQKEVRKYGDGPTPGTKMPASHW